MIVIADASCLITLANIGEVNLLPILYVEIFETPEVAAEVGGSLPGWVIERASTNSSLIDQLVPDLEIGEATSIALALELPDCLLIIDEKKGRRKATQLGLNITGTFGVIIDAFEQNLIVDSATIADRLEKAGFRLSEALRMKMQDSFR